MSLTPAQRALNRRKAEARRRKQADRDRAAETDAAIEIGAADADAADLEAAGESVADATGDSTVKKTAIPQLSIWERRLVDPRVQSSSAITLKTTGFTLRWINTEVQGRYQEAVYAEGWIPVERADLADARQIVGLHKGGDDTFVRSGPNGVYLLCKMPTRVYEAIARRKVEISQGNRRSAQKQRERIMQKAADHRPGGAEAIARMKGEITELIERVEMNEEDLTPDMPTAGSGGDDEQLARLRRGELA